GEDDEDDEERGNDDVEQLLEAVLQSPIDDEPDEADGDGMEQDGLERVGDEVLPHLLRIRARGELAGEREHEVAQSPTGDDRIVEGDAETDEADDAADPGESAPHQVAEGADGSQTRARAQDRFGHEDGDRPEKSRDDQGDEECSASPAGDDGLVAGAAEAEDADDAADPGESAPHEVAEGADGSQTRVRAQDRFGHEEGDRPEKIRDDQGDEECSASPFADDAREPPEV